MKIITRKENMVYREIRYMQLDLNAPVSEDMLKRNLDLPEHEYHDTITALENKGLISRKDGRIVAENLDEEVKVMETQEDVRVAELNQIEEEALRILMEIGSGDPIHGTSLRATSSTVLLNLGPGGCTTSSSPLKTGASLRGFSLMMVSTTALSWHRVMKINKVLKSLTQEGTITSGLRSPGGP